MLVPVPVWAEPVSAPALDQAGEAGDLARGRGWAEHPVLQRWVQVQLARIPPQKEAQPISLIRRRFFRQRLGQRRNAAMEPTALAGHRMSACRLSLRPLCNPSP